MNVRLLALLVAVMSLTLSAQKGPFSYPDARKSSQVDDFFGTQIADPYRWLEDSDSAETRAWIDAENKLTFGYLESIPERPKLLARLRQLQDYERFGVPSREGPRYIFSRNTGLQRQSVVFKADSLSGEPTVLIDPNGLSPNGTIAIGAASFSDDGRYLAYSLSESGSDWVEWHVRDVATAKDLPDLVKWSKFSDASWLKDGSGFYYSRYDEPKSGNLLQSVNKNQKVFFHKLGTPQASDVLVFERPDKPDWGLGAEVTEDGRFLLIYQTEGTENRNRIFVRDLRDPKGSIQPFLNEFDAEYSVVGNDGDLFYVLTDNGAPRYRLAAIGRTSPAPSTWKTVIPEAPGRDVLSSVSLVNDQFIATWMSDAHNRVTLHSLAGAQVKALPLPTIGSAAGFTGRRSHKETFYSFTSFTYPTTIYRYDFATGATTVFKKPSVAFDPARYETVQVFYPSKDGTKIPMFLTYRKGLEKAGQNPAYLYGYGGFNIATTPAFSATMVPWLEMGGVYAVANLRGGGEYGQVWYDAGRLKNKQNVFDDFIAAADFLIRERYTSPTKLAIAGGSNGGLLVGACLVQRPDLFGAAVPAVGVMDMLRYHKFTIGWAWKSDYGDPDTKAGFDINVKYSPLHNIKPGVRYPPTFATTADHDDRVVPAHSFKFIATLQAAQAGPAPVLIRIETQAGHGAGKPIDKLLEERADVFAFLVRELHISVPAEFGGSM